MAEQVVREWLAEYKSLSSQELHSFASTILENHELIQAIFSVIEDKARQYEILEPVCNQLFSFYRSAEKELQHFSLQFIPMLIGLYLTSIGQGDKRNCRSIEVLLLGIYNLEVVDSKGKPKVQSFRLPTLSNPSVYHEPMNTPTAPLTENALSRLEKGDTLITVGPFSQVETLNAHNRLRVMTILMNIYNTHLSYISKPSLNALCKICSRLMRQGFNRMGHHRTSSYSGSADGGFPMTYTRPSPRVNLTPFFMLELLHAVYFAVFNGFAQAGLQTLEDIHIRASYELYAEVILVTNAIRSSLRLSSSGQISGGPMGISIALSPSTTTTTISKSIITNASFRTKKLPDDIPIQSESEAKPLTTITEESEDGGDKARSSVRVKEKMSVVSLISKQVEKVKGSKTESNTANSNTAAKSKEKEGRKKSKDHQQQPETPSSGANGSRQNGDVVDLNKVDVSIIKNQSRNLIDTVTVEMKNIVKSGLKKDSRRGSVVNTEASSQLNNTPPAKSDDTGSLSSFSSDDEQRQDKIGMNSIDESEEHSKKNNLKGCNIIQAPLHTVV